ncbi:MAG: hypothetical protein NXI31_08360 [bacterium]|nr:hypothetical protein [bacterium]
MSVFLSYLPLLLLTIVLELVIVALLVRGPQRRTVLLGCVGLNLVTHPLATIACWNSGYHALALEPVVVLAEWLGYRALLGLGTGRALACSLLANLVTTIAGVAIAILQLSRMA